MNQDGQSKVIKSKTKYRSVVNWIYFQLDAFVHFFVKNIARRANFPSKNLTRRAIFVVKNLARSAKLDSSTTIAHVGQDSFPTNVPRRAKESD